MLKSLTKIDRKRDEVINSINYELRRFRKNNIVFLFQNVSKSYFEKLL